MITLLTLTRRAPLAAITAVALTGAVAAPVAGAAVATHPAAAHANKPKKTKSVVKKVKVADDFYAPTKMTIKVGDKVNFVWSPTNVTPTM